MNSAHIPADSVISLWIAFQMKDVDAASTKHSSLDSINSCNYSHRMIIMTILIINNPLFQL